MGLIEKIENIRKKPEHIRRRYVLFFVSISMVFIVMIWFASFANKVDIQADKIVPSEELKDIANQFNDQKESIINTLDGVKGVIEQDITNKMQDGVIE